MILDLRFIENNIIYGKLNNTDNGSIVLRVYWCIGKALYSRCRDLNSNQGGSKFHGTFPLLLSHFVVKMVYWYGSSISGQSA